MPITVVLVDDHGMLVDALTHHFAEQSDIEVAGRFQTLGETLEEVGSISPDVVLLDHGLPDGDAAASTRAILKVAPGAGVLLMSGSEGGAVLATALDAGVAGFVHKSRGADAVLQAVRQVAEGATAFEPADLQAAGQQLRDRRQYQELTGRELEILELMVQGMGTQAIADRLVVSHHTVRNHVRHVLEKLGAHSQLEAVAVGLRLRLVTPPGFGND